MAVRGRGVAEQCDWRIVQEHAERPHVVQRLLADAQVLVQSAQHLDVRLDKDVTKLQVYVSPVPKKAGLDWRLHTAARHKQSALHAQLSYFLASQHEQICVSMPNVLTMLFGFSHAAF